jgi:hypothetical protein
MKNLRKKAVQEILKKKTFPISYTMASENQTTLNFKEFEATYIDSKVTSGKRLFYNTTKPFEKNKILQ